VDGAADGRARAALARISYSSDLAEAVRDADLVIEAVPEVLDLKRDIYTKLGRLAPARTIFATNTSFLLPSAMADVTGRPERFLALHFAYGEIRTSNTAEVMGHSGTDPAVYRTVVDFARRMGMEPIELKKEQPGYIVNSLVGPLLVAAERLLVGGVAQPQMIDTTWRIATRAPEGPFQIMDRIGLNTIYHANMASPDEQLQAFAKYIKAHYLDHGKLGIATGEGFYPYPAAT
jgi:3-hydroxyacyl-CoA dehydrogenase